MTKGFKETEIGLIPEDWEIKKVRDVAIINEASIKNSNLELIEYIDIASVDKGMINDMQIMTLSEAPTRAKRLVKDDDILISTVRPNLKHYAFVNRAKSNTVASTGFAVISAKKTNPKFLYYYLTTDKYTEYLTAIAESHTSAYPSFNPDIIEKSFVPYPSKDEQYLISKVLSDLDDKIQLNNRMNQTLEEIGQAIFRHWFVDFEFPDENGQPYKSSGGEMVDSELGEIPVGWEIKPLDKVADYLNGLALQKFPPENDDYLPVIKIRELKQGVTSSTDKASSKIDPNYIIEDGNVIFSWSGSLEVVLWCGGKGALNQHLFKVSSENYPKWFYYYWTKYYLDIFRQIAEDKTTTMGHIKRKDLSEALVCVPKKEYFSKFNQIMVPLIDSIINNYVEARNLSGIRDSLLPKLMSGKIRVPLEDEK